MNDRYKAVEGSQSGHCCFEATVVDTTKPSFICNPQYTGSDGQPQCDHVCECFELEDAQKITAALNGNTTPFRAEQFENVRRAAEAGLKASQAADDSANVDRFQHIIDLVGAI